jgi:P-type Ca2+ transporter type 2C
MMQSRNFCRLPRSLNFAEYKFQLTVSVTAVGITFITAIANSDETPSITAVQLLWVNLIQDTLGALALATDPPTLALLDRAPVPKDAPMVTFDMWKMIFGQSFLQLGILVTLSFAGPQITGWEGHALRTVIFNTFVWLQFFNEINCRRLDNRLNVFEGIHKNVFFIIIMLVITTGQILIINFGGAAFSTTRLNAEQWLVSVLLGLVSLPSGALLRLIPKPNFEYFLPRRRRRIMLPEDEPPPQNIQEALSEITDNLRFFKTLRSTKRLSHRRPRNRHISIPGYDSDPRSPDLAPRKLRRSASMFKTQTVVPALIAGSVTVPDISRRHAENDDTMGVNGADNISTTI